MHLIERFIFGGVLTALGGTSGRGYHGGPGTVFINVTVGEEPCRMLQVDSNNKNTPPLTLAEANTVSYGFERIHLVKRARLNIKQVRKQSFLIAYEIRSGVSSLFV